MRNEEETLKSNSYEAETIYVALDPSINNVGWASYNLSQGEPNSLQRGWNWGCCKAKSKNFIGKIEEIGDYFKRLRINVANGGGVIERMIIEKPAFFDAERGRIAARAGYTIDMGIVIGVLVGLWDGVAVEFYTPMQWKGSVTKEVTRKKLERKFGVVNSWKTINEHSMDAIMILYHHLEVVL